MRAFHYQEFKKRLTIVEQSEDGKTKWLFEPGTLNGDLIFWDYEYLDPMTFYTKRPSVRDAARQAACQNGLKIFY